MPKTPFKLKLSEHPVLQLFDDEQLDLMFAWLDHNHQGFLAWTEFCKEFNLEPSTANQVIEAWLKDYENNRIS